MLHGVRFLQLWAHTGPGQVAYVPGQLGNSRQGCLKGSKHGLSTGLGKPFKELSDLACTSPVDCLSVPSA